MLVRKKIETEQMVNKQRDSNSLYSLAGRQFLCFFFLFTTFRVSVVFVIQRNIFPFMVLFSYNLMAQGESFTNKGNIYSRVTFDCI